MKEYTAAIIGTGRIGFSLGLDEKREAPASHTMAIIQCPRVKIISAYDTNGESLLSWEKYTGVKGALSLKNLLDLHPDIIVIAVNEDSHKDVALEVIKSRPRLVILEKPVALNMEEALEIKALSTEYKVPVMVNHERRFSKDYRIAKDYLLQLGSLNRIVASLSSSLEVYSKEKLPSGGYSLLHDGTHLIDIVHYFLEDPLDPSFTLSSPRIVLANKGKGGEVTNLCVAYNTPSCPLVEIELCSSTKYFDFCIEVWGETGRVRLGNGFISLEKAMPSKLYSSFYSLTKDESVQLPKKTGYFSNMVANAIDYLDGKSKLLSPLDHGIKALKAITDITLLL